MNDEKHQILRAIGELEALLAVLSVQLQELRNEVEADFDPSLSARVFDWSERVPELRAVTPEREVAS